MAETAVVMFFAKKISFRNIYFCVFLKNQYAILLMWII